MPSIPFAEQDYELHLIEEILLGMGRTLTEFRLPRPQHDWNRDDPLIRHELDYGALHIGSSTKFDIINAAIVDDPHSALFFLQGYAGTGKPFFIKQFTITFEPR